MFADLHQRGFVVEQNGNYSLSEKGRIVAEFMEMKEAGVEVRDAVNVARLQEHLEHGQGAADGSKLES